MIGPFWKTIELLDKKQNSLLTTIAVCSFCAALMLTIGIYKGEAHAEAAHAGEAKTVTALKPITQPTDEYSDAFGTIGKVGEDRWYTEADWKFIREVRRLLTLRSVAAEQYPHMHSSDQELLAALGPLVTYSENLGRQIREQEASRESKDAQSEDVGDSR